MTPVARSSRSRPRRSFLVQKPRGQLGSRVQHVGPEHFGIVSIDCAKARSKYLLADFYGHVLIPPTSLPHSHGDFQAAIQQLRQALLRHQLKDVVIAIEQTGEYHRPVQRAFRAAGWDVRLVHPSASQHFRQPADPGNKTDDTDLAAIHRATVNGFGLSEPSLPPEYQQLRLLIRHRRNLVAKASTLCCQIREYLHAALPGYAECFQELWHSPIALAIARVAASAEAIQQLGLPGLARVAAEAGVRCRPATLRKVLAWAQSAPASHPQAECLRRLLISLEEDRLSKTRQIQELEGSCASLLVRLPYVLLLAIPGLNVVSAADLAGEMGPPAHYANANGITGRAGLMPTRYQSDRVDRPDGPLRRSANRRLRAALLQIAENLVVNNHHFQARAFLWRQAGKDPRWIRVKVAKTFSRLAFAMLAGPCLIPHACCRPRHYILDKVLAFHRDHDTPMSVVLEDLQVASEQLPPAARPAEAPPLSQRLLGIQSSRRGPQELATIIPIVLARLGVTEVQCEIRGDRDLS
jgi:transposase